MAFSDVASSTIGSQSKTANQASIVVTPLSTWAAGKFCIIGIATDNFGTTDGAAAHISSIVDSLGNTWSLGSSYRAGRGSAQGGATVSLYYSLLTTGYNGSSDTVTFNLSNATSRDATGYSGRAFSIGAGSTVAVEGTPAQTATTAADPPSQNVTTANIECLRVRAIAAETDSGGFSPTASPAFTSWSSGPTSGGSAVTNMCFKGEYIISTGTGAASDPTGYTADQASIYVAFKEVAGGPPSSWTIDDTASAADTRTLAGDTSKADTASAGETQTLAGSVSQTDTATAGDTNAAAYTAPIADTATAADARSLEGDATKADTASGADASSGEASTSISDTASAGDSVSAQPSVSVSDSASTTETLGSAGACTQPDTGTGGEAQTLQASVTVSDTASAGDSNSTEESGGTNTADIADTATAVDAQAFAGTALQVDTGAAGELQTIQAEVTISDTASAADARSFLAAVEIDEFPSAADQQLMLGTAIEIVDVAIGADNFGGSVSITVTDTGSAADEASYSQNAFSITLPLSFSVVRQEASFSVVRDGLGFAIDPAEFSFEVEQ